MKANELMVGNLLKKIIDDKTIEVTALEIECCEWMNGHFILTFQPIKLTEEWLLKLGFSVITENSAGKRYGYVIDGIFSSDLTFTFWKTTKEAGKFFRGDLELKSVHQIQNLYFALTGRELTVC